MRAPLVALTTLLALALAPVTASSQDYFPLDELVVRQYQYTVLSQTGTSSRLFSGTLDINGSTATILHHVGGLDDGLQQFWEEAPDGDKLFHGFETGTGFQQLWSPPFVVIDMPVFVGKTWDVTSQGSDGSNIQLHFEVAAIGTINVPAGSFQGVSIEMTQALPSSKSGIGSLLGFDPFGTTPAAELYSYGDQTGLLRWSSVTRIDELLNIQAVGVESTSWSAIRALYR